MVAYTYNFDGADTAAGSGVPTPAGHPTLSVVSGSWRRLANRAHTDTAAASSPILAVTEGAGDFDITLSVSNQGGDAIYGRITDVNNCIRLKVRRYQTYVSSGYYEYEYIVNGGSGVYGHDHGDQSRFWTTSSSAPANYNYYHTHGGTAGNAFPENYHNHYMTHTGPTDSRYIDQSYYVNNYQLVLEKVVAGVTTPLKSVSINSSVTSIRLRGTGATLEGFWNGASSPSLTDASVTDNLSVNRHGIGRAPSDLSGSQLDNFIFDSVNIPPTSPTLVAPQSGSIVPRGSSNLFDWTHNDPDGNGQSAYALRVSRTSDGTQMWWNGSAFVLNETYVTSVVDSVNLPPNILDAGGYTWAVSTKDTSGASSPYSGDRGVNFNSAPNAPVLISPTNGTAPDLSVGYTFDWAHSDPEGNSQTAWKMRRKVGVNGTYEYWNATTETWGASEVTNSGAVDGYTFGSGKWNAGFVYYWSVATRDSGSGTFGAYATDAIVSAQAPPNPPILNSPPNGSYVGLAAGQLFDWTFGDPNEGDIQGAWALRRKIAGAPSYEWYNVGTAVWQASVVWNTSTSEEFTFSSGKWTDGNIYNWSVATKDGQGNIGAYSNDFTVTGSTAPTVVVVTPSGVVGGTTRPTVNWIYNDAEGQPQANRHVKVFESDVYLAPGFNPETSTPAAVDSGEAVTGTTSYTPGVDLLVGPAYRAYVKTGQAGGQYSPWTYSSFGLTINAPAIPGVTVVADVAEMVNVVTLQARDNILSENAASFEVDAGSWNVNNTTKARSTEQALDGAASLKLSAANTTSSAWGAWTPTPFATAGETYTGLASVRWAAGTPKPIAARLEWKDSGGGLISAVMGTLVTPSTSGWSQLSVTGVAPTGTVSITLTVYADAAAGAINDGFYLDRPSVAPGSLLAWSRGGLLGSTYASLESSDDEGLTWERVRNALNIPIPQDLQRITIYDYETLPNRERLYRAKVTAEVG